MFRATKFLCLILIACDGGTNAGTDAGRDDAGREADAGMSDGGMSDAGMSDGGMSDGGVSDAGMSDAGMSDAGMACVLGALDQTQLGVAPGYGYVSPAQSEGQTFTVGMTGRLSGIEVELFRHHAVLAGDRIQLDVFDSAGTILGTAQIVTSTLPMRSEAQPLEELDMGPAFFDLCPEEIAVTAGDVLRYRLSRVDAGPGTCTAVAEICTAGRVGATCSTDTDCVPHVSNGLDGDVYAGGTGWNFAAGEPIAGEDNVFKTFVD